MTTSETAASGAAPPRYRRKLRNYLLDVGLQLRYTGFIIAIALILTALLGYKIYTAAQETSRVIWMTGMVDPAVAGELKQQFDANDRRVLVYIFGIGVLLVLSIAAAGIWITHKVAGPLFSIEAICARVRDNKLGPSLRHQLRKGDELKDFYLTFREMYEALRTRTDKDVQRLGDAIAGLERSGASGGAAETLAELRALRAEKAQSLEP